MKPVIDPNGSTDHKRIILFFAGAGASAALDAAQYPTTSEFYKRLPKTIRGNRLFSNVDAYLKEQRSPAPAIDIEEVLWVLGRLTDTLTGIADQAQPLGYLIAKNTIGTIDPTQRQVPWRSTMDEAAKLRVLADNLTKDIHRQVYELYATTPTQEQLATAWLPLLRSFARQKVRVEIFTTNYDLIFEELAQTLASEDIRLETGRLSGTRTTIDTTLWQPQAGQHSDTADARITKLHGSVDWWLNNDTIFWGNPNFSGDHSRHLILYPGLKGRPRLNQLSWFHEYFSNAIPRAVALIFVGFAFRDEYINELLAFKTPEDAKIIVVNPDPSLQTPFAEDRLTRIRGTFDENAAHQLMDAIPGIVRKS